MRGGDNHLPTLDGWRAVAIIMVVLCHGSATMGLTSVRDYLGTPGVDVFFGLSGFLITSLLLKEEAKHGSISLAGFYRRRVFRILPAALCFLSAVWALHLAGLIDITPGRWFAALFFMANYSSAPQSWYVAHFWSLAVEEHFYLIWPLTLVLVCSNRSRLAIILTAIAFVDVWRAIDFRLHLSWSGPSYLWSHRTDIAADGILWGVAFALAYDRLSFLKRGWVPPIAVAVFAATCVLPDQVGWKTSLLLVSLRSAVVPVMILSAMRNPQSALGRVLESPPLRFVGLISYSLYLWQELFLTWEPSKLTAVQWFPLNIALAFGCATASLYLVERPMIALGRRELEGRSRGRVTVGV